jgi:hypothetical protein
MFMQRAQLNRIVSKLSQLPSPSVRRWLLSSERPVLAIRCAFEIDEKALVSARHTAIEIEHDYEPASCQSFTAPSFTAPGS